MSKSRKFVKTSKFPIRFDRLFPGSVFSIHAEVSRGFSFSRDHGIYRKAAEHEGFYAYDLFNPERAACLYPEDMVWPLREERNKKG